LFEYSILWVSSLLDTFGNLLWDPNFRVLSSRKCSRISRVGCVENMRNAHNCPFADSSNTMRCSGGLRDPSKFVSFCCCLNSTGVERVYTVGDCTSAANSSITFQCGLYCSSSEPLACCLIRNMRTLVCCNISCFFIAKSSLGSNHSNTLGVCSGLIGVSLFKMLH